MYDAIKAFSIDRFSQICSETHRRAAELVGQIRDNRDASQEAAMSSDPRWGDDARDNSWEHVQCDRDSRERDRDSNDPCDAFMRHVDLPRGPDRETVRDRGRDYSLRGSETRTLSTIGSFRVVPTGQLRDNNNTAAHDRSPDIRHLREQGLIETVRVPGHRGSVAVLTKQGRDLLERHRNTHSEPAQSFYAGLKRTRELEHDAQIYGA